jgi:hypothetical protein
MQATIETENVLAIEVLEIKKAAGQSLVITFSGT